MDYGLSRGFITSPVEDFPSTCAPHVQQIRLVKRPRDSGIETPFDVILLVPGSLQQPITMPGMDYGPQLKTRVMYPMGANVPDTQCWPKGY